VLYLRRQPGLAPPQFSILEPLVLDTLLAAFSEAGAPFMYAITAALAFGLAVLLERVWIFWLVWTLDSTALLDLLDAGDIAGAGKLSEVHPACRLVRAGAGAADAEAAWSAMATESPLVEADIQQRVPYLATVGNISTMIGLLGTVYGLIIAFAGLSDTSALEVQSQLNEGIATAMATTAWGLIVGIPALALCEAAAARVAQSCKS
jgi:biopolymer transport protein ExbB